MVQTEIKFTKFLSVNGILRLCQQIGVYVKIFSRITVVFDALFALLLQGCSGKFEVLHSDMCDNT